MNLSTIMLRIFRRNKKIRKQDNFVLRWARQRRIYMQFVDLFLFLGKVTSFIMEVWYIYLLVILLMMRHGKTQPHTTPA